MNRLIDRFWEKVINSTNLSLHSLSFLRIVTGLFLLIVYCPSFSWIENTPKALFKPPVLSLANFCSGFPPLILLSTLDIILIITSVFILLGIKSRISTYVYLIGSFIGFNFQYSFGKIDHLILVYCMLFCLSFSGWGQLLAIVPDKPVKPENTTKSLSLLAVILCFSFFTAGIEKAIIWIDFNLKTSGSGAWFYAGYFNLDRTYLAAEIFKKMPLIVLESMDYMAVLFELIPFYLLLKSRAYWRLWLIIACFFHIVNLLVFNIPFIANAIVYVAFFDFSGVYYTIEKWLKNLILKWFIGIGLIVVVFIRTSNSYLQILSQSLFFPDYLIEQNLYFTLVVWSLIIILMVSSLASERKKSNTLHIPK